MGVVEPQPTRSRIEMPTSHDEQHHGALDRGGGQRDDGLSGFIILRLSERAPGDRPDLRSHAEEFRLDSLLALLDELGGPPTRRAITVVEPRELLREEEEVMDSRDLMLDSLTRYWCIDVRGLRQSPHDLVKRFSELTSVELAYAELAVSDPAVIKRNPLSQHQGYLKDAPEGIGALWAHRQPGGRGQHAGVCDIERAWRLKHEDLLRGTNPRLIPDPTQHRINEDGIKGYIGHHGTAVMGVIAAVDNTLGVIGIAPSLGRLRAAAIYQKQKPEPNPKPNYQPDHDVRNAVYLACKSMSRGDILLLEVQRGPTGAELPTEIDHADFLAIRHATKLGRIVVASAGNGNCFVDPELERENGVGYLGDSGAIMVGACKSALVYEDDGHGNAVGHHEPTETSNYGSRIDCHAWGENVTTCGGTDAAPNTSYRHDFSGTSSAAAIIAGAAALIQSMYRAPRMNSQPLKRVSPTDMRGYLSNQATATGQAATPADRYIGSMPNLHLIKTAVLNPLP